MVDKNRTKSLREESGMVVFSDPLTSFLYQLMRDEVPCGTVEKIVQDVISEGSEEGEEILYTNGYLAKYANNLAELIKNSGKVKLKNALDNIFITEEERIKKEVQKVQKTRVLKNLEEKINNMKAKAVDKDGIKMVTIDDAKTMVNKLQETGGLSEAEAARINGELDDVREGVEERQREEAQEIEELNEEDIVEIIIDDESLDDNADMKEIDNILADIIEE